MSQVLSTITSNVFTEFTICFPQFYMFSEDQTRWWNSVDNVLDRLGSLYKDVTLVVRPLEWARGDTLEVLMRGWFPLMWKHGKVIPLL